MPSGPLFAETPLKNIGLRFTGKVRSFAKKNASVTQRHSDEQSLCFGTG